MKKLIAFLLVFAMLAALPVLSASAAEAAEVTLIRTADELRAATSGNYRLAADIDLGGQELTAALAIISGTLDGNGHSIENFSLKIAEGGNNIGLFELSGDLTVKNLTVGSAEAPIAVSGGTLKKGCYAGVLLRNNSKSGSTYDVTFENVDVYADMDVDGARAGVFLGSIDAGSTVSFTNCTANGSVAVNLGGGGFGVGGFAGSLTGGTAVFTQCINNAAVSKTSGDNDSSAGGFIGYMAGNATVTDCINNGAIKADWSYAAALFGLLNGDVSVDGFWNSADIEVVKLFAGSVFGRNYGELTVTDVFNSGDIISTDNFYGSLGGLNDEKAKKATVNRFVSYGNAGYRACANNAPAMTAMTDVFYCGTDFPKEPTAPAYMTGLADLAAVVEKLNSKGFLEGFRAVYGDFTEELTPVTSFATVEVAGWQTSTDGADLRLIGYVDAFGYASVGFELAVDGGVAYQKNDITTVYTTVSGAGKTYTAQSLADRAGYLYALVITDVPVGAQLTVTPTYTTQDGAVIKGQAVTVTMPAAE